MSVTGKALPSERAILALLDREADRTISAARQRVAPIVDSEVPQRTGKVAKDLQPRASKTRDGSALTVQPSRRKPHRGGSTIAEVVRRNNRGTGIYREGPGPKLPIRPKRRWRPDAAMILPGGKRVRKVRGQKPNPYLERIRRRATPVVDDVVARGADDAARALERLSA